MEYRGGARGRAGVGGCAGVGAFAIEYAPVLRLGGAVSVGERREGLFDEMRRHHRNEFGRNEPPGNTPRRNESAGNEFRRIKFGRGESGQTAIEIAATMAALIV